MKNLGVLVPDDWISKLDKIAEEQKYSSRAEFVRAVLRKIIASIPEAGASRPEKAESEKGPRVVSPEEIKKDIVNFPPTIAITAMKKLLKRRGYSEKQANQAIDILVVNGIYRKEENLLVLKKKEGE